MNDGIEISLLLLWTETNYGCAFGWIQNLGLLNSCLFGLFKNKLKTLENVSAWLAKIENTNRKKRSEEGRGQG